MINNKGKLNYAFKPIKTVNKEIATLMLYDDPYRKRAVSPELIFKLDNAGQDSFSEVVLNLLLQIRNLNYNHSFLINNTGSLTQELVKQLKSHLTKVNVTKREIREEITVLQQNINNPSFFLDNTNINEIIKKIDAQVKKKIAEEPPLGSQQLNLLQQHWHDATQQSFYSKSLTGLKELKLRTQGSGRLFQHTRPALPLDQPGITINKQLSQWQQLTNIQNQTKADHWYGQPYLYFFYQSQLKQYWSWSSKQLSQWHHLIKAQQHFVAQLPSYSWLTTSKAAYRSNQHTKVEHWYQQMQFEFFSNQHQQSLQQLLMGLAPGEQGRLVRQLNWQQLFTKQSTKQHSWLDKYYLQFSNSWHIAKSLIEQKILSTQQHLERPIKVDQPANINQLKFLQQGMLTEYRAGINNVYQRTMHQSQAKNLLNPSYLAYIETPSYQSYYTVQQLRQQQFLYRLLKLETSHLQKHKLGLISGAKQETQLQLTKIQHWGTKGNKLELSHHQYSSNLNTQLFQQHTTTNRELFQQQLNNSSSKLFQQHTTIYSKLLEQHNKLFQRQLNNSSSELFQQQLNSSSSKLFQWQLNNSSSKLFQHLNNSSSKLFQQLNNSSELLQQFTYNNSNLFYQLNNSGSKLFQQLNSSNTKLLQQLNNSYSSNLFQQFTYSNSNLFYQLNNSDSKLLQQLNYNNIKLLQQLSNANIYSNIFQHLTNTKLFQQLANNRLFRQSLSNNKLLNQQLIGKVFQQHGLKLEHIATLQQDRVSWSSQIAMQNQLGQKKTLILKEMTRVFSEQQLPKQAQGDQQLVLQSDIQYHQHQTTHSAFKEGQSKVNLSFARQSRTNIQPMSMPILGKQSLVASGQSSNKGEPIPPAPASELGLTYLELPQPKSEPSRDSYEEEDDIPSIEQIVEEVKGETVYFGNQGAQLKESQEVLKRKILAELNIESLISISVIAEQVYERIEQKLASERRRRGL